MVLESWKAAKRRYPDVTPRGAVDEGTRAALREVVDKVDRKDPAGLYLYRTALSYLQVTDLIGAIGHKDFNRISRDIYGGPGGFLAGASLTHYEAAQHLIRATEALQIDESRSHPTMTAEEAASWMANYLGEFFEEPPAFVVDNHMSARASASASRVRLHGGTRFSEFDLRQLAEHEIFVHALTAMNGREQKLQTLGRGAARTTATQEGLATFAELVTGSIDLDRLHIIAMRICAIRWAEEGADLYELIDKLVEHGEKPKAAVRTALRIFRGGDPKGKNVFTKDTVYLKGLFAVHTFLRKAISNHQPKLIRRLFAGRLALSDVTELEDAFNDGFIEEPKYVPRWAENLGSLAGFLVVSALIDHVALREVTLDAIEEVVDSAGDA